MGAKALNSTYGILFYICTNMNICTSNAPTASPFLKETGDLRYYLTDEN